MTEISAVEASSLVEHFADMTDPRQARGIRHALSDIITISILAVICGADSYSQIHQYALGNEDWLKTFLKLPSGIPSQDTFERVFSILDPQVWQARFLNWRRTLVLEELPEGDTDEILAIDGKTARGSAADGMAGLHTVSIWSSQFELVLAQQHVPEKSNEITVIPELLETTTIAGAIVTADAMGCQKDVAWAAREHHAHYLLALKDNHPTLHEDVQNHFDYAQKVDWRLPYSYTQTFDRGHGREELRECWVLKAPTFLHEVSSWRDLHSIVRVRSQRTLNGKTTEQTRYFVTSLPLDAERALRAARYHWGIENGLHWVLDVAFAEDASRARLKNAQATWVALRHLAISLLKRDKTLKVGVEAKRKRAGWDRRYLLKLLEA